MNYEEMRSLAHTLDHLTGPSDKIGPKHEMIIRNGESVCKYCHVKASWPIIRKTCKNAHYAPGKRAQRARKAKNAG